jgi:flagellar basal-body rod protein FlgG
LGTRNTSVARSFAQGDISSTGNSLDLAIQGDGFFQVLKSDGTTAYTRAGAFRPNSDGRLCTAQGYPVTPEIQIPADAKSVTVGVDGTVSAITSQDTSSRVIGQLELSRFINPTGLSSEGQNLYTATAASGDAVTNTPGQDGLGSLVVGSLENSNVNLVSEMVNMIQAQRGYEINSKAVQASDDMMRITNSLKAG